MSRRKILAEVLLTCRKKETGANWKNGYLHGFTDTYHVAGYGREWQEETYEPFWFRTYRFIGLEIQTGKEPLKNNRL